MKPSLFLLLSLLLFSCKNRTNEFTIQSNGKIVLIDSSAHTDNLWPYDSSDRIGYYPVYYMGPLADTFRLGSRKIIRYSRGQKDYIAFENFTLADSFKMKIVVDTTFSVTHIIDYLSPTTYDVKDRTIDSTRSYKSFPIFIYNLSDSLISAGIFSELGYTIRQVKDKNGKWKDIERLIDYGCGYGARQIVIEPHQVIIAMLPRYKGTLKTACRLKFSVGKSLVYSNTFYDYIDERQLTDSLRVIN